MAFWLSLSWCIGAPLAVDFYLLRAYSQLQLEYLDSHLRHNTENAGALSKTIYFYFGALAGTRNVTYVTAPRRHLSLVTPAIARKPRAKAPRMPAVLAST